MKNIWIFLTPHARETRSDGPNHGRTERPRVRRWLGAGRFGPGSWSSCLPVSAACSPGFCPRFLGAVRGGLEGGGVLLEEVFLRTEVKKVPTVREEEEVLVLQRGLQDPSVQFYC